MRKIKFIVVHCTATRAGQKVTAAQIDGWHRQRGFKSIGYHIVIGLDGYVEIGRPLEEIGAHCRGINKCSIGVAYVGGLDANGQPADTRTPQQRKALLRILRQLKREFPDATIIGHRDVAPQACPCFDALQEYLDI